MTRAGAESQALLLDTDEPEVITAVRHALTAAGIPYETGLRSDALPSVAVFVPWSRLTEAREIVRLCRDDGTDDEDDEIDAAAEAESAAAARFPWTPVRLVAGLVALHAALALLAGASASGPHAWFERAGIVPRLVATEPWRLVTSLFLHVDLRHALWNGVSLLVFGVPLLALLGTGRTAAIYLAAGIGGGVSAAAFAHSQAIVVGSSGATVGLFGAWVVLTLRRARYARLGWRQRVRGLGIALLVLPSVLAPANAAGQPVSVASHLGGLAAGMLIGAALSETLLRRAAPRPAGGSAGPGPFVH